jgi:hypothetical protein
VNNEIFTNNIDYTEIDSLISENVTKKIHIIIDKHKFDSITVPEDKTLYYFPEECPTYEMDIFLVSGEDEVEKYFIPEKNFLLLIEKDHKWTNPFDMYVMWKK